MLDTKFTINPKVIKKGQRTFSKNIRIAPDILINVTFILMIREQMKNKSKKELKHGGIFYYGQ